MSTHTRNVPTESAHKIINILPADNWLAIYPGPGLPVQTRQVSFFALVETPNGERTVMPARYRGGKLDLIDPASVAAVVHRDDWDRYFSRISKQAIQMWEARQQAEVSRG